HTHPPTDSRGRRGSAGPHRQWVGRGAARAQTGGTQGGDDDWVRLCPQRGCQRADGSGMRLYIRTQDPGERRLGSQYDYSFDVHSQSEWKARIDAVGKSILTSVLKADRNRFRLRGRHLYGRSHKHETHYVYDPTVNESYRQAAERLAARIEGILKDSRRC